MSCQRESQGATAYPKLGVVHRDELGSHLLVPFVMWLIKPTIVDTTAVGRFQYRLVIPKDDSSETTFTDTAGSVKLVPRQELQSHVLLAERSKAREGFDLGRLMRLVKDTKRAELRSTFSPQDNIDDMRYLTVHLIVPYIIDRMNADDGDAVELALGQLHNWINRSSKYTDENKEDYQKELTLWLDGEKKRDNANAEKYTYIETRLFR